MIVSHVWTGFLKNLSFALPNSNIVSYLYLSTRRELLFWFRRVTPDQAQARRQSNPAIATKKHYSRSINHDHHDVRNTSYISTTRAFCCKEIYGTCNNSLEDLVEEEKSISPNVIRLQPPSNSNLPPPATPRIATPEQKTAPVAVAVIMPSKVAPFSFFRSHSNNLDLQEPKKQTRRFSNSKPTRPILPSPSSSNSSLNAEERTSKMGPSKRLSFPNMLMHSPKSSSKSIPHYHPVEIRTVIESPPLVFYGSSDASTGALLSGQLKLNVHEDFVPIESLELKLVLEVTRKKPFHAHCPECMNQNTELTKWSFTGGGATTLKKGKGPCTKLATEQLLIL